MDYINSGISGIAQILNGNYQCFMFLTNIGSSFGVNNLSHVIMNTPVNIIPNTGSSPYWGPDAWATVNMNTGAIDLWNVGSISDYTIQEISQGFLHELVHYATQGYDVAIAMTLGFQYSGSNPNYADDATVLAASGYWDDHLKANCKF